MAYEMIGNRFLRSFRSHQLDRLSPIEPVELRPNALIYRQDQPVSHVIFLETGLVSASRYVSGRTSPVELWMTGGTTGVIGAHTVLHTPESFFEYRSRVAGNGWRVPSAAVHAAMSQDAEISAHIARIARISNLGIAQLAACRLAHSHEQRLCRLLLCVREALGTEYVPLSRRTLADMMLISRGHTFAITKSFAGVVTFSGDHLFIDNPGALMARACGCFTQMHRERLANYP